MTKVLREPLLHFLILGGALFAIDHAMRGDETQRPAQVVLSEGFVEGLRIEHQQRTGSPPSDDDAMIAAYLREEALYRQALALGLDANDPIVRRRMVQKMEFLLRSGAAIETPTDAQLQRYLESHRERFEAAERVSFTHVFFSRERRTTAEADAHALRAELDPATERAEDRGDPFLHGYVIRARSVPEIARTFGDELAAAVRRAEVGVWSGPHAGDYGWHLVRVHERLPGGLPPLREVHARVARAWAEDQRDEALERATRALVDQLEVVRE